MKTKRSRLSELWFQLITKPLDKLLYKREWEAYREGVKQAGGDVAVYTELYRDKLKVARMTEDIEETF